MERWERIAKRVNTATRPVLLTKGEIARQLNMSRPALNRRLDGEVEWEYDRLETLAHLLGITIDQLAGYPDVNGTSVTEG